MSALESTVVPTGAQPQLDFLSMFGNSNVTFDNRYKFSQFSTLYPEVSSERDYRFCTHTDYGNTVFDLKKIRIA